MSPIGCDSTKQTSEINRGSPHIKTFHMMWYIMLKEMNFQVDIDGLSTSLFIFSNDKLFKKG
ncbi:UNVERIFIED_CONTAM: hypothetical protein NCL1_08774 [Trichonephila clavipes]